MKVFIIFFIIVSVNGCTTQIQTNILSKIEELTTNDVINAPCVAVHKERLSYWQDPEIKRIVLEQGFIIRVDDTSIGHQNADSFPSDTYDYFRICILQKNKK